MLDLQLGARAIPDDVDPRALRDGPEFSALEAEINKLVDIHAAAPTDWELVANLSANILSKQGKDLSVGAWLVAAWVNTNNASGLVAGFKVLRDLHEQYWDSMLPPVKRIRGRRNQINWLLDILEKNFTEAEDWPAITDDEYAALQADWDYVDGLWQEKDDEPPSFFKLRKYIDALQVESVTGGSDIGQDPAIAPPLSSDAETKAQTLDSDLGDSADSDRETVASEIPESGAQISKPVSQTAVNDLSQPDLPATAELDNVAAVENYIEQGLEAIQQPLPEISDELLYTPFIYRFNRQCAWMLINQLPHANETITAIPAPRPVDQDSLQNLVEANDVNAILRFCEAKLPVYRFWLDLNYAAFKAASQLPESVEVANTVLQETAYFVNRMPGLLDLCFNDETPFANNNTKNWLASNLSEKQAVNNKSTAEQQKNTGTNIKPSSQQGLDAAPFTEDTLAYTTTLAVASAETRAALNLLEVVANRLQAAADQINSSK